LPQSAALNFQGVNIVKAIIANVVSALVIAVMLGAWTDHFYKTDKLAGIWKAELHVQDSEVERYEGMKMSYTLLLQQEGQVLRGVTEKVSEEINGETKKYQSYDRVHGEVSGTIAYSVFSDSTLDLVIRENGRIRGSSTILNLEVVSQERLVGTFTSTAASSKGAVVLTRAE